MGSSDPYPSAYPFGGLGLTHSHRTLSHHTHRKTKVLKVLDTKHSYVLGRDVMMNRVFDLCSRALIGILEY